MLSFGLALALTAIVVLVTALNAAKTQKASGGTASPAIRAFWSPFVANAAAPWVIFSNAAFVGRPETGMRYLDRTRDSHPLIMDHYTGVGEVLAVHELDEVFNRLNHSIRVKRGSLFSLDDANENDLIFVGSPAENLTLLDLPGTREFVFTRPTFEPHKGELAIRNVHPEPGQPPLFYPSDSSQPLEEDYAIVALVHGLNPARHVMILAGITTIGTQAAVEYVCEQGSVEELTQKLSPQGEMKPFEATNLQPIRNTMSDSRCSCRHSVSCNSPIRAPLLCRLQLQLTFSVDLCRCVHLFLRILLSSQAAICLAQQRVRNVIAWIHLLCVLQVQQRRLRIVPPQQHLAHLNERPRARGVQRDRLGERLLRLLILPRTRVYVA